MLFSTALMPTLARNLALDEAYLLAAESGGPEILRLWAWPEYAVVLGAGGKLVEDVDEEACRRDGVQILRRSSGGGTVLLGPGCLNYSLVLAFSRDPRLADIRASYSYVWERLAPAFPGGHLEGTSDFAIAGRKFSGNAQQRKRDRVLHHGTLLYDFDLDRIGRYLRQPERQPEYREGRTHDAFVRNLDVDRETLEKIVRSAWPTDGEAAAPVDLLSDRFGNEEWIRRR